MTDMKEKLKELLKEIDYTPLPEMTMTSNLANQFTDYALDSIVQQMLDRGITPLPVKPGDTLWTNMRWAGDYMHIKSAPYPVEVVYIGIHNADNFGGGYIHIKYKSGRVVPINFDQIDKLLFRSEKEARAVLEANDNAE